MTDPILFFLAIALIIIAVAFLISWMFRRAIRRDKRLQDINDTDRDGEAAATWIGIDEGDGN